MDQLSTTPKRNNNGKVNTKEYSVERNLPHFATKHITFLRALHSHGVTLNKPSLESLHRYTDLWLPLVFRHQNSDLIPPADIAWLWHCHRLAPFYYVKHLKKEFGTNCPILEAKAPFTVQFDIDDCNNLESSEIIPKDTELDFVMEKTRDMWHEAYPNAPFFLSKDKEGSEQVSVKNNDTSSVGEPLCGFDLLSSTERQATFLWQVSGPNFSDPLFLEEGQEQYYKFLQLRKYAPTQILVPTYQIDLMWHTHMLHNLGGYYRDCNAIMGSPLHHDDSLNDRTEGGPLDTAFAATKSLWKQHYGNEYYCVGGMYRGEPPEQYYTREWSHKDVSIRSCHGNLTPRGPFLQFVGIHGASSTNPPDGMLTNWTSLSGAAPDGKPGFMAPHAKSTTKGVNANTFKKDYIFGNGASGLGYYHVTTKEAHKILLRRLKSKESKETMKLQAINCFTCFLCGNAQCITDKEQVIHELKEAQRIIKARAQADVPYGIVDVHDTNSSRNIRNRYQEKYYTDTGIWIFPGTCYANDGGHGGGCGACGPVAGGCGGGGGGFGGGDGAGCGAAGCGAAACGGGGCGGGGCGGGGCGGG